MRETSVSRGIAEWGEVFGDPVVATALIDGLLRHAVVIQIGDFSFRMREQAVLVTEKGGSYLWADECANYSSFYA